MKYTDDETVTQQEGNDPKQKGNNLRENTNDHFMELEDEFIELENDDSTDWEDLKSTSHRTTTQFNHEDIDQESSTVLFTKADRESYNTSNSVKKLEPLRHANMTEWLGHLPCVCEVQKGCDHHKSAETDAPIYYNFRLPPKSQYEWLQSIEERNRDTRMGRVYTYLPWVRRVLFC